jgi:pimeloyl-ACP methyl ester carboxylesterase
VKVIERTVTTPDGRLLAVQETGGSTPQPGRPYDADGLDWFDGMGADNADDSRLYLTDPAAARAKADANRQMLLRATGADLVEALGSLFSPADAAVFTGELADYMVLSGQEALAPGSAGWSDDECAQLSPWGFDLASISVPVLLVHGRQDQLAPFSHGQWLAAHVPRAEAWLRDDDGHFTIYEYRVPEVHAWLSKWFTT